MMNYLAVDFGTTHIKAGLFDERGGALALRRLPTPTARDAWGVVYDPAEIGRCVRKLLRGLEKPWGIVVTGMAEAGLTLRKSDGMPLSPILPWFDPRTREMADAMSPEESEERFFSTGLRNSFKYGVYKYRWCREQLSLAGEKTVWLSATDYLVYLLTGAMVTDPTFASRTYGFELRRGTYDAQWLAQYGISPEEFPEVRPSGTWAGMCRQPGWEDVPVYLGAHDHLCAAFAMQLRYPDAIYNSCGTAETYIGLRQPGALTMEDYHSGYVFGKFPGSQQDFWMANVSASGLSLEWFRKKLRRLSYADVVKELASQNGPTGLLYFPALTGMGTPCFRQDFPGTILGITPQTDWRQLLCALLEGVCYQGRLILEPAGAEGVPVVSVGGATESGHWLRRKADNLRREIITLAQKEATMTGAVALMLTCAGNREAALRFLQGEDRHYACTCPETYEKQVQAYTDWYRVLLRGLA